MARATQEQSDLDRWLYRLGYASVRFGSALNQVRDSVAGAAEARDPSTADPPETPPPAWEPEIEELEEEIGSLTAATAAGMILAQLLRPRRVNWPRAILAGTIGTLLYDAENLLESRSFRRKFSTRSGRERGGPDRLPALGRYAAGIGMAAFYARYLYGRLPGPPLLQGLAYGVLESGTRSWGGAVALLGRLSPEVDLPAGYSGALARGTEGWLEGLRRHAAFGIGVGLVYRAEK